MRRFNFVRHTDVSGVSGVGTVAEGIEFHDGQVVMSWFGRLHTMVVAPNIAAIIEIHGHGGASEVVWLDD